MLVWVAISTLDRTVYPQEWAVSPAESGRFPRVSHPAFPQKPDVFPACQALTLSAICGKSSQNLRGNRLPMPGKQTEKRGKNIRKLREKGPAGRKKAGG